MNDKMLFNFQNEFDHEVTLDFIGIDAEILGNKKHVASDGTIGLAPWTADPDTKEWNTLH